MCCKWQADGRGNPYVVSHQTHEKSSASQSIRTAISEGYIHYNVHRPQTEKRIGKKEEGKGGGVGKKKQEGREGGGKEGEDPLHELCFLARMVHLYVNT